MLFGTPEPAEALSGLRCELRDAVLTGQTVSVLVHASAEAGQSEGVLMIRHFRSYTGSR